MCNCLKVAASVSAICCVQEKRKHAPSSPAPGGGLPNGKPLIEEQESEEHGDNSLVRTGRSALDGLQSVAR